MPSSQDDEIESPNFNSVRAMWGEKVSSASNVVPSPPSSPSSPPFRSHSGRDNNHSRSSIAARRQNVVQAGSSGGGVHHFNVASSTSSPKKYPSLRKAASPGFRRSSSDSMTDGGGSLNYSAVKLRKTGVKLDKAVEVGPSSPKVKKESQKAKDGDANDEAEEKEKGDNNHHDDDNDKKEKAKEKKKPKVAPKIIVMPKRKTAAEIQAELANDLAKAKVVKEPPPNPNNTRSHSSGGGSSGLLPMQTGESMKEFKERMISLQRAESNGKRGQGSLSEVKLIDRANSSMSAGGSIELQAGGSASVASAEKEGAEGATSPLSPLSPRSPLSPKDSKETTPKQNSNEEEEDARQKKKKKSSSKAFQKTVKKQILSNLGSEAESLEVKRARAREEAAARAERKKERAAAKKAKAEALQAEAEAKKAKAEADATKEAAAAALAEEEQSTIELELQPKITLERPAPLIYNVDFNPLIKGSRIVRTETEMHSKEELGVSQRIHRLPKSDFGTVDDIAKLFTGQNIEGCALRILESDKEWIVQLPETTIVRPIRNYLGTLEEDRRRRSSSAAASSSSSTSLVGERAATSTTRSVESSSLRSSTSNNNASAAKKKKGSGVPKTTAVPRAKQRVEEDRVVKKEEEREIPLPGRMVQHGDGRWYRSFDTEEYGAINNATTEDKSSSSVTLEQNRSDDRPTTTTSSTTSWSKSSKEEQGRDTVHYGRDDDAMSPSTVASSSSRKSLEGGNRVVEDKRARSVVKKESSKSSLPNNDSRRKKISGENNSASRSSKDEASTSAAAAGGGGDALLDIWKQISTEENQVSSAKDLLVPGRLPKSWTGFTDAEGQFRIQENLPGKLNLPDLGSDYERAAALAPSRTTPGKKLGRRQFQIRTEIASLVTEHIPEKRNDIDDLLQRFEGREEKLLDTLRKMSSTAPPETSVRGEEERPPSTEEEDRGFDDQGEGELAEQQKVSIGRGEDSIDRSMVREMMGVFASSEGRGVPPPRRQSSTAHERIAQVMSAAEGTTGANGYQDIEEGRPRSTMASTPAMMGGEYPPHQFGANRSPGQSITSELRRAYEEAIRQEEAFRPMAQRKYDQPYLTVETAPDDTFQEMVPFEVGIPRDQGGSFSVCEPSTIGAPSVYFEKRESGVTPTTVSDHVEHGKRPMEKKPFWRNRRNSCLIIALFAACVGAFLGLYFSGIMSFGSDDSDASSLRAVIVPTVPPAPRTAAPSTSIRPTAYPSASPSSSPITSCTETLTSGYETLGLMQKTIGKGHQFAPNVAMDGDNAVVSTESGGVRFYSLANNVGDDAYNGTSWEEIDYFPNVNRATTTPAVSISGRVAVVGFVWQTLGFGQGIGGAYVYEQNPDSGRWKRATILTPEDTKFSSSSRYAWSVDVYGKQKEPLVAVGAHGDAGKSGSVYVFQKSKRLKKWIEVGKILPEYSAEDEERNCKEFNFGYSVRVHGDVIAATTDCEYIVQLNQINQTSGSISTLQNIPYISFELGAVSDLVMNEHHLVYSTVFGGVAIYERTTAAEGNDSPSFDYYEQLDFSGNRALVHYPLALDRDVLVIGYGNEYWVFPKHYKFWGDGPFYVKNRDSREAGVPSVAVSGRYILAGSESPQEVYHYNTQDCMYAMPTQSPTLSSAPTPTTPLPTGRPSLIPSISLDPSEAPTLSPSFTPSTSPSYSDAPSDSSSPTLTPSHTSMPSGHPSLRPSTISSAPSLPPTNFTSASALEPNSRTACLTKEECEEKGDKLGMTAFNLGNYPTKGCYSKNGKTFFSHGTEEEMSQPDLSGNLKRIWCDNGGRASD